MKRRQFVMLTTGASVVGLFAATAEALPKYRLGCLLALPRDAPENVAFFEELKRRGFIEG
jgi:hypothetical protein